jgi:hypothetical protein
MSETPVGLLLVGAAFVTPEVAAEQAPRIMESVKSLRLVETTAQEGAAPGAEVPETPEAKPGPDNREAVSQQ